ncbi:hypothetical protein AAFF_G00379500 [Aldrovandia affinis]|uniref:Uncharacterized protein n=1 Tax=Aldrovandia affinis TaxID=143900 RepID=A0AAD7SFR1_9TELE|nr:hypothetical protein AAFF_G00379500 [Aldrovandia affinis]
MSGKTNAESEGVVSKVKVKRQIKTIVKDLENILGDLKDVAKELKEVVHDIDSLTSDLRLEEEMTDSSKTDTLNSSSSSTTTTTTASSIEKKHHPEDTLWPSSVSPAILTVMRRPHPPTPSSPNPSEDWGPRAEHTVREPCKWDTFPEWSLLGETKNCAKQGLVLHSQKHSGAGSHAPSPIAA